MGTLTQIKKRRFAQMEGILINPNNAVSGIICPFVPVRAPVPARVQQFHLQKLAKDILGGV